MLYVEDGDTCVLMGTNGGADEKLCVDGRCHTEVIVEAAEQKLTVKPTFLRKGPQRERLHSAMADYKPISSSTRHCLPHIRADHLGVDT
jgi:hypothetical protein